MKFLDPENKLRFVNNVPRIIKWGVAGCGHFTETSFIPAVQVLKRSRLVSVFSHDMQRAKYFSEKYAIKNAFNDFDEFLKSNFDVLYVCSANIFHFEQVIKAAKAGKHILCEKPLALTSAQAKEMVETCKANNVFLTLSYNNRYHPLVIKTKELIQMELIGKLISINMDFNIDFPPGENFRFKKELSGGGALRDLGTHLIDLMRYFGGEADEIIGYTDNVIYHSDVEDFAAGIIKFDKSGYGKFSVSYNSKKAFNRVEIIGYKGTIALENLFGRPKAPTRLIIDLVGEKAKAFRKRANKMYLMLREIQRCLLKNEHPEITGLDGLINLKLMEELESQCRQKKKL